MPGPRPRGEPVTEAQPPLRLTDLRRAGLYDPRAPDAAERKALLRFLVARGATLDDLVEAERAGRLPTVLLDRLLGFGRGTLTLDEAAARAGLAPDQAARARQAVGLPIVPRHERAYGRVDVEMLRAYKGAVDVFGEEVALELGRVLGSSLNRLAEAEVAAFLRRVSAAVAGGREPQLAVAEAAAQGAALLPTVGRLIDPLHRRHLQAALQRFTISPEELATAPTVEVGVGFADLVGFTSRSQHLSVEELSHVIATFEARTADVVAAAGGRLVKLIGDEVMYVAESPAALVQATVGLLQGFADDDRLPPLRAGLAWGPVLLRDGDYFGPVVNLASRAVALARPRTALVTPEVWSAVPTPPEGYRYGKVRLHRIKGFDGFVRLRSLRPERVPLPRALRVVEAVLAGSTRGES